jgi:hypothetical protein
MSVDLLAASVSTVLESTAPPSARAASAVPTSVVLSPEQWRDREARHQARADALSAGRRARSGTGATHPVDDFLFTYYPMRPGLLRRWHPGAGARLEGAASEERASWKWYASRGDDSYVDAHAFVGTTERSLRFIVNLLGSTAARPASFGCFGLHEWAMVYRQEEHRHEAPLRLSQDTTDTVVESHKIVCTHFDAFRFFTPPAIGLNRLDPTRENQPQLEQPGCLHAGMDVYKWATKLGPLVPGELLLDAFELARDIRQVDMRASPYDLSAWGYEPIAIETPDGKAHYVRAQREFAERGNVLRGRLIAAVAPLLPEAPLPMRVSTGGARKI